VIKPNTEISLLFFAVLKFRKKHRKIDTKTERRGGKYTDVGEVWERKEEIVLVSSFLLSHVNFLPCCCGGTSNNWERKVSIP
jgi:hypothetical protein